MAGKLSRLHNLFENIVHNVPNVVMACIDRIHLLVLYIKANGLIAGFCKLGCKGQPTYPKPTMPTTAVLFAILSSSCFFTSDIFHTYLILIFLLSKAFDCITDKVDLFLRQITVHWQAKYALAQCFTNRQVSF